MKNTKANPNTAGVQADPPFIGEKSVDSVTQTELPAEDARAPRFPTDEILNIEVYGSNEGPILAVLKNLSHSGAFIEVGKGKIRPSQGEFIRATLKLDSIGKSRTFNGEVIWVNGGGFGVAFMKKDELVQKLMAKFAA